MISCINCGRTGLHWVPEPRGLHTGGITIGFFACKKREKR